MTEERTLRQMRTVVVRLHAARRVRSIDMERMQMGTNLLDGRESLRGACCGFQDLGPGR